MSEPMQWERNGLPWRRAGGRDLPPGRQGEGLLRVTPPAERTPSTPRTSWAHASGDPVASTRSTEATRMLGHMPDATANDAESSGFPCKESMLGAMIMAELASVRRFQC